MLKTNPLLFLFFLLAPEALLAGSSDDPFNQEKSFSSKIEINAGYQFSSDAITNHLARTYFLAGFIDRDMKNTVSKQLFPVNRLGADAGYSITYTRKINSFLHKPGFSWFVSLVDQDHLHAEFTRDAFEIYFKGNSAYAGRQAELGKFDFFLLHYQQILFGLQREYSCGHGILKYEFGIGFNKGQKFQALHSDRASLFTSADGEYLDIDFDLTLRGSDSLKSNLGAFNGTGGSLQFAASYTDEQKNEFSFRLQNFGFIQFSDQSYSVPADSNFKFEGIDATSLFDFSDSIRTPVSSDSTYVRGFLTRRSKGSYSCKLPARLSVSYRKELPDDKTGISIGLDHVFFTSYLPHGWCRFERKINNRHQFGVIAGYGGYTLWQLGLSYKLNLAGNWLLGLESPFLSGWLNSKSGRAQGAFVSLRKYL
ncbi:MAG TPA: DUF5723 family protein [Bacteroidia bacterium]|nr:DUF5723 family protein [Bacteroidia bacterium]